jgi:hypothetical protein
MSLRIEKRRLSSEPRLFKDLIDKLWQPLVDHNGARVRTWEERSNNYWQSAISSTTHHTANYLEHFLYCFK